ncbi:hypothetical protein I551_3876 [Mycobacterium ulcerans str. Harvey]|uniref:Uncharacterized protein n=1 Tax=Mycobacterium ulcerans str. Harvey TaxID=1299332 RepID=A0ABP3AIP1_MYCUL|nr:hypothetical protein I551_3876 [Mycobacterium ulcerans str. Harvey]
MVSVDFGLAPGPQRVGAPGASTLMTSAPMSPRSRPAKGPAIRVPSSSTRIPSSAPGSVMACSQSRVAAASR